MTPTELSLLRDLVATHQDAMNTRFDTVDSKVDGINERLDQLNGRVRKVEQSQTRLKVTASGLGAVALLWLRSILHF